MSSLCCRRERDLPLSATSGPLVLHWWYVSLHLPRDHVQTFGQCREASGPIHERKRTFLRRALCLLMTHSRHRDDDRSENKRLRKRTTHIAKSPSNASVGFRGEASNSPLHDPFSNLFSQILVELTPSEPRSLRAIRKTKFRGLPDARCLSRKRPPSGAGLPLECRSSQGPNTKEGESHSPPPSIART